PARPSRRVVRPRLRVHRLPPLHATAEAEAAGAPRGSRGRPADAAGASNSAPSEGAIAAFDAGDQATARSLAILFAVRGAQGALLAFPAVLLLVLEPRQQPRRRAERPELEDDLAVFLVLRFQEHAFALVDDVDRLLERDFVVAFPFLTAREVEPFHVEEEEPPPGLPHPSFPLFDERLLRERDRFEDGVLQGAISDDLIATGEDGFVRIREDDPHLTDLIDLHPTCRTPGVG